MKKALFLVASLIITFSSISQNSYEKKIDIELTKDLSVENVYTFKESGVLLISKQGKPKDPIIKWEFSMFDSDLAVKRVQVIELKRTFKKTLITRNNEYAHVLFKGNDDSYTLISINNKTTEITRIDGTFPKRVYGEEQMTIIGDNAVFAVYNKGKSTIMSINWKTGEQKLFLTKLKGYQVQHSPEKRFQYLKETNEIIYYNKKKLSKHKYEYYAHIFSQIGEHKSTIKLSEGIEKNIDNIHAIKTKAGEYLFAGTYGNKKSYIPDGLFFCKVLNDKVQYLKFYNYLELENFFKYLNYDKGELTYKREKLLRKGKDLDLDYYIYIHDIVSRDKGFLFYGEVYFPTYIMVKKSYIDHNGNRKYYTSKEFDGYRYSHALIVKIDDEGELKWDQVFDMSPGYKPTKAKKFMQVQDTNNLLIMKFIRRSKVYTKTIKHNGDIINKSKSAEFKAHDSGEGLTNEYTRFYFWYDDYIVGLGRNRIKEKGEKRKYIYFISKIKYK